MKLIINKYLFSFIVTGLIFILIPKITYAENLSKINGEHKGNELVNEVISFIEKDKKRPICSPQN